MKKIVMTLMALCSMTAAFALEPIKLDAPDLSRGISLMESLSQRHSVREFAAAEISRRDLSDLLWAANGVNRKDGGRTAPSAMNRQPISLYVVNAAGVYRYDHEGHSLVPVSEGDFRQNVRGNVPAMNLLVVAADKESRTAGVDAGYVSQNIYLACTALNMATVSCGTMDEAAFRKACKLDAKQMIVVQHPVGYPVK